MTSALTPGQFAVLNACRDGVARTQRDLARATELSLGHVNQTLRGLREAGLVDGAVLTEAGWAALAPYKVRNAVIMAAGMSTRFAPISYEHPKGQLVVKGEVLIERQIRQLQAVGITDITVVVGYRQEQFLYLEDAFEVTIVVNTEYDRRNNTSSIRAAQGRLGNTYVCSSDNYFAVNVFEPYVYQAYYAAVWQTEGDEWGLMTTPGGRITKVVPGALNSWVMLGHTYWDHAFARDYLAIQDRVYDDPATAPKLWEAVFADHVGELTMHVRRYDPGIIFEFDTLDDLRAFDPDFVTNIDSAILDNICTTLGCSRQDLGDFTPITEGLTNLSFRFTAKGEPHVYRHPGVATQGVLNRAAEAQAEVIAAELGLDETFVHIDPVTGWKISRYYPVTAPFDYHNPHHVDIALSALRTLHTCGRGIDNRFDLLEDAAVFVRRLCDRGGANGRDRLGFPDFALLAARAQQLGRLTLADHVTPVLCHNDFYCDNLLVAGDKLAVIDWEYTGMGDPASDLGVFICCCEDYTYDDALWVLRLYYQREPTPLELAHAIAYVSIAGYHWWVWALYKDAVGEGVGEWTYLWYRYAKEYGVRALELYAALA